MRCGRWITAIAVTALAAGCGGPVGRHLQSPSASAPAGTGYGEAEVRNGRVERIDAVQLEGEHQLGVGHVLGAVAGGALGHQFGGGKARIVAQVVGSLGGGAIGGGVQKKLASQDGQMITVSLANGVAVGVTQPVNAALRIGDCVRIDGSGQSARVVPASCAGVPPADTRPTGERLAAQFGPQGETVRGRVQAAMRQPAAAGSASMPAAGTAPTPDSEAAVRMGRVVSVEALQLADADDLGLHQISNGVAGDAMGYRLPGGASREFTQVANVLGGTGTRPAASFTTPRPGQYVLVRLDNGIVVGITQLADDTLRAGDRVRIDGAGSGARVVRG
jgi:outer membrane lipoprotein SlyB